MYFNVNGTLLILASMNAFPTTAGGAISSLRDIGIRIDTVIAYISGSPLQSSSSVGATRRFPVLGV
jgi:hypothetical protein